MRFLFTLTIFLGSALLFLVEPMVAKLILPKFGGAPAVWTASMVFFQVALLLGYGYAHVAVKWLGPRKQAIVHAVVFLLALGTLPIVLAKGATVNGSAMPALTVIGALATMVGLPFLLVSAGAPLIQRWFAHTNDPLAKDPYFLYSASNLGSMIALLAYPVVIEPQLGLAEQSKLWTIAYGCLGGLLVVCALLLKDQPIEAAETGEGAGIVVAAPESVSSTEVASWPERLRWIALAAVPSSLLLAVTTHITTVVAPVPLLWVVPLALYLLSFILAFARHRVPTSWIVWPALVLACVVSVLIMVLTFRYRMLTMSLHLAALFFIAWACHQSLADERPRSERLTEFFFFLALGGVVGGVFNSLIAPAVFHSMAEYPIALCAAALLLPRQWKLIPNWAWLDLAIPAAVAGIAMGMVRLHAALRWDYADTTMLQILGIPIAAALVLGIWRARAFALSLAAVFLVAHFTQVAMGGHHLVGDRSFFGVHDVYDYSPEHRLVHGTTTHGSQDMSHPTVPVTYYTRHSPIGQLMAEKQKSGAKPAYAVVGLGAGTMAAYGLPGEIVDIYEIDPTVIAMSENPKYFTYLQDSPAHWHVIEGDARLSLQAADPGKYEVIVLDAFSSDAIPIHLLTREAIEMYLTKLSPTGIIAFHISNRYLDLAPVIANACRDLGLVAYEDDDLSWFSPDTPLKYTSDWVMVGRNEQAFGSLAHDDQWFHPKPDRRFATWTDDRSSILPALLAGHGQ